MGKVIGVVFLITIELSNSHAHRVASRGIRYPRRGGLTTVDRDLLVRGGKIALGRLRLTHRVGALGKLKGVGVAVGVGGEHAHRLTGSVVDGELRAFKGVAVIAVGDAGVGAGFMHAEVTGDDAPVDLEETGSGLGVAGGDNDAYNRPAAGNLKYAELLAVVVSPLVTIAIGVIRIVPAGIAVEVRVELSSRMAAQKGQVHVIGDFDRTGVLCGDVSAAQEARAGGIKLR